MRPGAKEKEAADERRRDREHREVENGTGRRELVKRERGAIPGDEVRDRIGVEDRAEAGRYHGGGIDDRRREKDDGQEDPDRVRGVPHEGGDRRGQAADSVSQEDLGGERRNGEQDPDREMTDEEEV